ncbi:MAG: HNH endonuclease, partial [Planctomycetia bacterium]|nr:HNH endonuclease [Planctomycetia bacterium]
MSDISPSLHAEVVLRAGQRCEYCQLSQLGQEATFHIDHVVPRAAGGPTTTDNLRQETHMAGTLAQYLARYTAEEQAYPATAFYPVACACSSDRFTLDRAGTVTRRTCIGCEQVRFIDRFGTGDGWLEAVEDQEGEDEDAYFCAACAGDQAHVCLGFAGYPEAPELDAVKWFYVGVRCAACGADE